MTDSAANDSRWWGRFSLDEDIRGSWHVGPLCLGVARSRQEWRIERHTDASASGSECHVEIPSDRGVDSEDVTISRFSFTRTSDVLWLTPRFADRAVVISPENPFYVTAGQEIVLFCSTPLWVRVEVGDERTVLEEFPTVRPSDTWFGSSTREGELCYATTTAARLRRQDLLPRPHRATTELRILNEADDTLQIEKINLSVVYLSLYAASDGSLWSDRVTLHRTPDGSRDELEIVAGAPEGLNAERVSDARLAAGKDNVMVRAFEALFTGGK